MRPRLGVACLALVLGFCMTSAATVVQAIPLNELVASSEWVVVATVKQARSHYVNLGGVRRVVTESELQIHQCMNDKCATEMVVRSLGGSVGDLVHHVYGEALLAPGSTNLLFLRQGTDKHVRVVGRAQGEYHLVRDGHDGWLLRPSRGLDGVRNRERSAVAALARLTLSEAWQLVSLRRTRGFHASGTRS